MSQGNDIIRETDVAGRIGGYFGVAGSDPRIATLLSKVLPEIQKAASGDPASWQSAFQGVMVKYEGLAKELGLGVSQTQRDLDLLKNANRTDAAFASAAGRLGIDALRQYARIQGGGRISDEHEGTSARGGTSSSAAYARETLLTMNGAINFAKELGISPIHATFFEGGSPQMGEAVRDAIRSGKVIADDKVKDMHDVSMVLGAIRAGKLREDDPKVPDSIKKVIKQMREDGVDPVKGDAKVVKKYLDDHPKMLDDVRARNDQSLDAVKGKTDAELKDENLTAKVNVASSGANGKKSSAPKVQSAKLGGS